MSTVLVQATLACALSAIALTSDNLLASFCFQVRSGNFQLFRGLHLEAGWDGPDIRQNPQPNWLSGFWLSVGQLNPGLSHDRRGCLPLYNRGCKLHSLGDHCALALVHCADRGAEVLSLKVLFVGKNYRKSFMGI